ncbi:hypothetical protein SDJN03_29550, partial [Cucurbita argyrosperma subsp. sororia]
MVLRQPAVARENPSSSGGIAPSNKTPPECSFPPPLAGAIYPEFHGFFLLFPARFFTVWTVAGVENGEHSPEVHRLALRLSSSSPGGSECPFVASNG